MSDTPEIIRLYTDMKLSKDRYNEAVRGAGEFQLKEIKAYMEQLGFRQGEYYSDKVYRMEYIKDPDFWISLPKRKLVDSSLLILRAISQLDELEGI